MVSFVCCLLSVAIKKYHPRKKVSYLIEMQVQRIPLEPDTFLAKSMRDSEAIAVRGAGNSVLTKMIVQRLGKVDVRYR
jgi:hypothetical protein